jgi:ribosomal protein S18 acetylase RimI-like enzyme
MKIELTTSPSAEDAMTISQGLMKFNQTVIGHLATDAEINFSVFARTDDGTVGGGLRATCFWNMLHVEVIWLGEDARGQGIGTSLMQAAEEFAVEQGYELALLESSSWQAKLFYEKLGYELLATVPEYPRGYATHFLPKP